MEKTSMRITTRKLDGDSLTPILIFRRLRGTSRFLLESSSRYDGAGRYSFIGVNPVKSYVGGTGKLEEQVHEAGTTYVHEGELYSLLKRLIPQIAGTTEFPFIGGAVGYIGYGTAQVERKTGQHDGLPDVHLHVYDTVIVFDHLLNEVTIVHVDIHPELEEVDLETLAQIILAGEVEKEEGVSLSAFSDNCSQANFEQHVRHVQRFIEAGTVEQVVLSRRLTANMEGDPFALYRALRKRNPSPYMYYIEFGNHAVIGTSPESLVKVTDRKVVTNPIAGTRRRGRNETEDRALEVELRNDPKEQAEHDMLVDLSASEMRTVCEPSTVQVQTYRKTVRYEHVMHLVSELEGELDFGLHALDALKAVLPAGTVTGSPKRIAMDLIAQLEKESRGLYGGAVGYIGYNGQIDFALAIRTMLVKEGKAVVQAGAGIVKDSVPALEYQETENKARSLLLNGLRNDYAEKQ